MQLSIQRFRTNMNDYLILFFFSSKSRLCPQCPLVAEGANQRRYFLIDSGKIELAHLRLMELKAVIVFLAKSCAPQAR